MRGRRMRCDRRRRRWREIRSGKVSRHVNRTPRRKCRGAVQDRPPRSARGVLQRRRIARRRVPGDGRKLDPGTQQGLPRPALARI